MATSSLYYETRSTPVHRCQSCSGLKHDPGCDCGVCKGLQCLCRPRFFAGQLLTERDLNLLEQYMTAKQRLQNRYLHGWGTVCGLAVDCDPCGKGLIVRQGYALSPCGNDIVVCDDEAVDFCALIDACRDELKSNCQPPFHNRPNENCSGIEEWILAICYKETPSRGLAALHRSPTSCGKCGSAACSCGGCSCGKAGCTGQCDCESECAIQKPQPPVCEPTQTCETYCFTAYKPTPETDDDQKQICAGRWTESALACMTEIFEVLRPTDDNASPQSRSDLLCRIQDALWRFFAEHPTASCDWQDRLRAIYCPPAHIEGHDFQTAYDQALLQIALLFLEYVVHCLCEALLPPCPPAPATDCVPLAKVTIDWGASEEQLDPVSDADHVSSTRIRVARKPGCRVVRVCNWTTERKFVTTFPTLGYWLEPLQLGRLIREAMDDMCCNLFGILERYKYSTSRAAGLTTNASGSNSEATAAGGPAVGAQPLMPHTSVSARRQRELISNVATALLSESKQLTPAQLYNGLLGGKDAQGASLLSERERSNPVAYIGLEYLVKPILRDAVPDEFGNLSNLGVSFLRRTMGVGGASPSDEGGGLEAELASLRETVRVQGEQIAALTERDES